MKMALSTIINLWPMFQRRDLSPSVNDGVGRLNLSRYNPSDLAFLGRSWIFSHGCHEDVYLCNIYPDSYILDNGDLYSQLSKDVD
jgi:hypothetical protein